MKIPNVAKSEAGLMVGVLMVGGLAVWWLSQNTAKVAQGAANVVSDTASGLAVGALTIAPKVIGDTANGVAAWANSSANPLQPVGAAIGVGLYDAVNGIKKFFGV